MRNKYYRFILSMYGVDYSVNVAGYEFVNVDGSDDFVIELIHVFGIDYPNVDVIYPSAGDTGDYKPDYRFICNVVRDWILTGKAGNASRQY